MVIFRYNAAFDSRYINEFIWEIRAAYFLERITRTSANTYDEIDDIIHILVEDNADKILMNYFHGRTSNGCIFLNFWNHELKYKEKFLES